MLSTEKASESSGERRPLIVRGIGV
jgi:hypothetical protein